MNIEMIDFLKEILKINLKLENIPPQNVAILFNLSIIQVHLNCYFVQNIIFKIVDFFLL